ncbi:hypothetical protein DWF04_013355 [Cereibacter sphaeroides f. sp. denitrificans]
MPTTSYELDETPIVSPQDKLTLDILFGAPVPRTLTDAREMYLSLGKGPKNPIAQGQFDRAWKLVFEITADVTLDQLRREHANELVRRLLARRVTAETIRKYISQVSPVIASGIREFELSIKTPSRRLSFRIRPRSLIRRTRYSRSTNWHPFSSNVERLMTSGVG